MKKVLLWVTIFCICLSLTSGTCTSYNLTIVDSRTISQIQEGPDIYIRYNGMCADGMIILPRYFTYNMQIEVSDPDNVTEVFADISDSQSNNPYRVYASLNEGNVTDGVWMFTISKYIGWSGGVFDVSFTVWACDGLGNWNSALGYRSTGMSPSFLLPLFPIGLALIAVYAIHLKRKRDLRFKEMS